MTSSYVRKLAGGERHAYTLHRAGVAPRHGQSVAIMDSGMQIAIRIPLPEDRIPPEAYVEIKAQKAAAYDSAGPVPDAVAWAKPLGRELEG